MRREDWPHEIARPQVLANFRRPMVLRDKPTPWQKKRTGMDPGHLVLVRQLPCTVCENRTGIDPHHLKSGAAARERGIGMKATDRWSVPLCRVHHDEVERLASIHERAWFSAFGLDPHMLALALWGNTGDLMRMLRVLNAHKQQAIRDLARRRRATR